MEGGRIQQLHKPTLSQVYGEKGEGRERRERRGGGGGGGRREDPTTP